MAQLPPNLIYLVNLQPPLEDWNVLFERIVQNIEYGIDMALVDFLEYTGMLLEFPLQIPFLPPYVAGFLQGGVHPDFQQTLDNIPQNHPQYDVTYHRTAFQYIARTFADHSRILMQNVEELLGNGWSIENLDDIMANEGNQVIDDTRLNLMVSRDLLSVISVAANRVRGISQLILNQIPGLTPPAVQWVFKNLNEDLELVRERSQNFRNQIATRLPILVINPGPNALPQPQLPEPELQLEDIDIALNQNPNEFPELQLPQNLVFLVDLQFQVKEDWSALFKLLVLNIEQGHMENVDFLRLTGELLEFPLQIEFLPQYVTGIVQGGIFTNQEFKQILDDFQLQLNLPPLQHNVPPLHFTYRRVAFAIIARAFVEGSGNLMNILHEHLNDEWSIENLNVMIANEGNEVIADTRTTLLSYRDFMSVIAEAAERVGKTSVMILNGEIPPHIEEVFHSYAIIQDLKVIRKCALHFRDQINDTRLPILVINPNPNAGPNALPQSPEPELQLEDIDIGPNPDQNEWIDFDIDYDLNPDLNPDLNFDLNELLNIDDMDLE